MNRKRKEKKFVYGKTQIFRVWLIDKNVFNLKNTARGLNNFVIDILQLLQSSNRYGNWHSSFQTNWGHSHLCLLTLTLTNKIIDKFRQNVFFLFCLNLRNLQSSSHLSRYLKRLNVKWSLNRMNNFFLSWTFFKV